MQRIIKFIPTITFLLLILAFSAAMAEEDMTPFIGFANNNCADYDIEIKPLGKNVYILSIKGDDTVYAMRFKKKGDGSFSVNFNALGDKISGHFIGANAVTGSISESECGTGVMGANR